MSFKLLGVSAIVIMMLGGLLYVAYNEITNLHEALATTQAENKQLAKTIDGVNTHIATHNSKLSELDDNVSKIRKETSRLDKVLAKLDLNKMAAEDPELLQQKINKATKRLLKELEEI